ncbi:MAG TPA: hypothetical protein DEB39_02815, partial [Planctomycetaceae bacterium]|nr:hypothetical protein [Planctomycetaceae bacterium]
GSDGYWAYCAAEFGGGTWAVKRSDDVADVLMYHDYQFLLGFERKRSLSFGWAVELGYMFGREIKYDSDYGKMNPEDMFFLRFKASY